MVKRKTKKKVQIANAKQTAAPKAKGTTSAKQQQNTGKAKGTSKTPTSQMSDMGPQNPMLMNQIRRPGQPEAPTGMNVPVQQGQPGEEGNDYFRAPAYQIDGDGDLPQQPQDSITPARVSQSVRMRWNPIRGLTFERLVKYLDEFWYGYFRQCTMTWQQMMRRDYQLRIDATKRFKSVARHGWEISMIADLAEDSRADAEDQKAFLEDFYNNVTVIEALNADHQGGVSLLLRQMMESMAYYYAVHEIVWEPKDDGTLGAKLIYCPIWWFEGVRGKLRYLQSEFQVWGAEMAPAEWMITVGDGLMECASILYMLKHGALKSWVNYLDKFGMPGLLGKTHAKKGTPEWTAMKEAIAEFSQEWATVIGGVAGQDMKENDISLVEARNSENGNAFNSLIEKLDRAMTQLWRGGDLGTSSRNNSVGASLQQDEGEIHETDDAKMLEETLNDQLTKYALQWKFGGDVKPLVYVKLRTTPKSDFTSDLAVDQFLVTSGFPMSVLDAGERYNRTPAEDGEETLQPMQLKMAQDQQDHQAGMQKDQLDHQADMQGQKLDAMSQMKGQNGATENGPANGENGEAGNNPMGYYFPGNASSFSNSGKFDRTSMDLLASAYKQDLQPLVTKLKALLKIEDPEHRRNRAASFLNDLEKFRKDLRHDNEASSAIAKILSSALANGLTAAKQTSSKALVRRSSSTTR